MSTASIFWSATGLGEDEERAPWAQEHFGMTTAEAMAGGCVPVVIDRAGQREIVREGVNGFRWSTPAELIGEDRAGRRRPAAARAAVRGGGGGGRRSSPTRRSPSAGVRSPATEACLIEEQPVSLMATARTLRSRSPCCGRTPASSKGTPGWSPGRARWRRRRARGTSAATSAAGTARSSAGSYHSESASARPATASPATATSTGAGPTAPVTSGARGCSRPARGWTSATGPGCSSGCATWPATTTSRRTRPRSSWTSRTSTCPTRAST